jgi:cytochrome c2
MKHYTSKLTAICAVALLAMGLTAFQSRAADPEETAIKKFMKTYHKAPKSVDPVCKRAADGKASADELNNLIAGYSLMASSKPPKGDDASWKEKTGKLLGAAKSLQKGEPGAAASYKAAVDCKACHSAHKPS